MKIKQKLIIIFSFIVVLSLSLMGGLAFINIKQILEDSGQNKIIGLAGLEAIADLKVDKIESFFNERKGDIRTAQDYYNIKTNLPILTKYIDDRSNPEYLKAKKMMDGQLRTFQRVYGYDDIMILDVDGKTVYSSNNTQIHAVDVGKPLPDPTGVSFNEGKKDIYFSSIFKSPDGHFRMFVTAPIHDFDKKFIGVIALETNMTSVYKFIQDTTGLGNTGETLIGHMIADDEITYPEESIGNVLFLNPLRHDSNAALNRIAIIGKKEAKPIQYAASGKSGSGISIDYRGGEILAAWRYIPSLDWGLVAKIDTKEAFAEINSLRRFLLIIAFIILLFSISIIWLIASNISKPIVNLTKFADKIAKGKFDEPIVSIKTKDEVAILGDAFSKMRDQLVLALGESENIINAIPSPLFTLNQDGAIRSVNPKALELLGFKEKELIGQSIQNIIKINKS